MCFVTLNCYGGKLCACEFIVGLGTSYSEHMFRNHQRGRMTDPRPSPTIFGPDFCFGFGD